MKTRIFIPLLTTILIFSTFVSAENFSVSNPAEFQAALNSSADNGETDFIDVSSGTYTISSLLSFYSEENYGLSIQGTGANSTLLEGGGSSKLLSIETTMPGANVSISGIGFNHGRDDHGAVSINMEDAELNISNCHFRNNIANEFGGGMTVYSNTGETTIEGCLFENNRATGNDAGGLYVGTYNGQMTLRNSTFNNNEALGDDAGGSMLYSDAGGTAFMSGNIYNGNRAAEDAGGAMVYLLGEGSEANIIGNNFYQNQAYLGGGGIWIRLPGGGDVRYTGNHHEGNITEIGAGGGFLLELQIEGDLTFKENYFEDNHAGFGNNEMSDGGGAWIEHGSGTLSISKNDFFENTAYNNGGGIFIYTESGGLDFFRNSLSGNTANNVGGGLSFATNTGVPYCYHNSFYANSAASSGGGTFFYMEQTTSGTYITNSIYWNNQPEQFEYSGPGTIMLRYCNIDGGTGQSWFGAGCIDMDPLFENPANNNLLLTWENFPEPDNTRSPCIDAGDPGFPTDPDGSIPDIGAYYWGAEIGTGEMSSNSLSMQIYPNPAGDQIHIEYAGSENCKLRIFDLKGRQLFVMDCDSEQKTLNISFLPGGMYIMQIQDNFNSVNHKFLKK